MFEFCQQYGLLQGASYRAAVANVATETNVGHMLAEHKQIRQALKDCKRGNPTHLVKSFNRVADFDSRDTPEVVSEKIRFNNSPRRVLEPTLLRRGDKLTLKFLPPDLITLMWMQFVQHEVGGGTIVTCEKCGKFSVVGPGTGGRITRKWCPGGSCSQAGHRDRQRAKAAS
jgi:hypothetical protein